MEFYTVSRVCTYLSILSICSGVALGLALLWGAEGSAFLWKCLATDGVVLLGANLTLGIVRKHEGR